jgi:D-proline reductase (dithiol) PrdB
MCHQTVSLVQAELERRGIVTASLSVMPEVTRRLSPPRALVVDAPLGAPLGPAHDVALHLTVLRRLLRLLGRQDVPLLVGDPDVDGRPS